MPSFFMLAVLVASLATPGTAAVGEVTPPVACRPAKSTVSFAVDFTPPKAPDVSTALLRIGYRSDRVSLPGTGGEKSVQRRIKPATDIAMLVPNDLEYALRLVVGRPGGIPVGRLVTIEFDRCEGAPPPTPSDLSCEVETCASSTGAVDTCRCQITAVAKK